MLLSPYLKLFHLVFSFYGFPSLHEKKNNPFYISLGSESILYEYSLVIFLGRRRASSLFIKSISKIHTYITCRSWVSSQ